MAMIGDGMGASILAKIQAIPGIKIIDTDELTKFCNAVGEAVVEYIQSNADVLPGTLNNPSGQPVSTPSGSGATSAPEVIQGIGKVQ